MLDFLFCDYVTENTSAFLRVVMPTQILEIKSKMWDSHLALLETQSRKIFVLNFPEVALGDCPTFGFCFQDFLIRVNKTSTLRTVQGSTDLTLGTCSTRGLLPIVPFVSTSRTYPLNTIIFIIIVS